MENFISLHDLYRCAHAKQMTLFGHLGPVCDDSLDLMGTWSKNCKACSTSSPCLRCLYQIQERAQATYTENRARRDKTRLFLAWALTRASLCSDMIRLILDTHYTSLMPYTERMALDDAFHEGADRFVSRWPRLYGSLQGLTPWESGRRDERGRYVMVPPRLLHHLFPLDPSQQWTKEKVRKLEEDTLKHSKKRRRNNHRGRHDSGDPGWGHGWNWQESRYYWE
mmetsp:Transcript_19699/g.35029  ORF Transcript_19699/g.35029 Transcript_19699/m.35029 type:complete len:224 (-) Transcript_19699:2-673(-)